MPRDGQAVSDVRFKAWTVTKDREVIMTADGPIIAQRGEILAVAVGERWEDIWALLKQIDPRPAK